MTSADVQEEIRSWFAEHLPGAWFTGPAEIDIDNDEVLVVGPLAPPAAGSAEEEVAASIRDFRELTRQERMAVASAAQHRFGRKVSWGVTCGERRELFTTTSSPVMTRLRQPERRVLDTLVEAGVARSRSEALAWCVRLVGQHESDWLKDLRDALVAVQKVRGEGPASI
jgi:hypothetical protein